MGFVQNSTDDLEKEKKKANNEKEKKKYSEKNCCRSYCI